MMKIALTDRLGNLIEQETGENEVTLVVNREYGFEDILVFETKANSFVEIDIDPTFNSTIIYTPNGRIVYQIPEGPKRKAYHPEAFTGRQHRIMMKSVEEKSLENRRNLALNALDKRWDTGYYPHASANVVTRDEPWFEAKNAIDGHLNRDGHGAWPYQSWGGGLRDDLEFTLDFGRKVCIDEIVIYLRADYMNNHDINWESATIDFSDGSHLPITMIKSEDGQSFTFQEKKVNWIKLKNLKREVSAAFSALTQIEVYGVEG